MMKLLHALTVGALVAIPAQAADVGVSVTVGHPGFYGHIDIGRLPVPPLIFPQPVIIIQPQVVAAPPPPLYLRVPPGHERDWGKHCRKYDACGRPVYFVRDDWYQNVYIPHHHDRNNRDDRRRGDRDDRDDRGDRDSRDRRDAHPGKGHGHGKGRRDD